MKSNKTNTDSDAYIWYRCFKVSDKIQKLLMCSFLEMKETVYISLGPLPDPPRGHDLT